MIILKIDANGQDGDVIADAARFVCAINGIDNVVDNVDPGFVPTGPDIFSTQGFYTSDCIHRSFMSMQDEDGIHHNRFSKVPFFLTNACHINDFIAVNTSIDNLGNLYALGHNGLICMGTSDDNYPGRDHGAYVGTLNSGLDFGQAFLAQANANFGVVGMYCLLGSGALCSRPYVQFGTEIEENKTITTTATKNSSNPVLIRNVTVSPGATYTVTSSVVTSPPQNCAQSEVVVRPETWFKSGSEVDLATN